MNPPWNRKNEPTEKPQAGYQVNTISLQAVSETAKMPRSFSRILPCRVIRSIIIERGDGYFRVSAGSFNDKQTATGQTQRISESEGMNNAWVMALN